MVNFIPITRFSLLRKHFVYMDSVDCLADEVFSEHGLSVKFSKDFVKEGEQYKCVFCSVKKKDISVFKECMEELIKVMLLTDHSAYCAFCIEMYDMMKGGVDGVKSNYK